MIRVALYVDVSNIYYCMIKKFGPGKKLDYSALLEYVRGFGQLTAARAYESVMPGKAGLSKSFTKRLVDLGFIVREKRVKTYREAGTVISHKADWDVGIAVDMIRYVDDADLIVLACADGDMHDAVAWLRERGKQVIVLAVGISVDLKEVATKCLEIPESLIWRERETAQTN
jgi:uncharacterized LabA/DUF88 family protein